MKYVKELVSSFVRNENDDYSSYKKDDDVREREMGIYFEQQNSISDDIELQFDMSNLFFTNSEESDCNDNQRCDSDFFYDIEGTDLSKEPISHGELDSLLTSKIKSLCIHKNIKDIVNESFDGDNDKLLFYKVYLENNSSKWLCEVTGLNNLNWNHGLKEDDLLQETECNFNYDIFLKHIEIDIEDILKYDEKSITIQQDFYETIFYNIIKIIFNYANLRDFNRIENFIFECECDNYISKVGNYLNSDIISINRLVMFNENDSIIKFHDNNSIPSCTNCLQKIKVVPKEIFKFIMNYFKESNDINFNIRWYILPEMHYLYLNKCIEGISNNKL